MPEASVTRSVVWEDSSPSLMARVVGVDGSNVQQADIDAITYEVFDAETGDSEGSGACTVASVIFDSLQTDSRWTVDDTGYNFRYELPSSELPASAKRYRVEFAFTPSDSSFEDFFVVFELATKKIFTS